MDEREIDARYGPIDAVHGPSRKGLLVGFGAGLGLFVIGVAIVLFAAVWLRVPGERAIEQAGLLFVGAFLALFTAPLVVWNVARSIGDRLELRALGVVRRSRTFGLKHCRYGDIARIEETRKGHVDLFTRPGALVGVGGFEIDPKDLVETIRRRATTAGAPLA